jgi:hypothetical protein
MLVVRVDDKRFFALSGKPNAEACGGHGLTAPALSVCYNYNFAHTVPPVFRKNFLALMKHHPPFAKKSDPFLIGKRVKKNNASPDNP